MRQNHCPLGSAANAKSLSPLAVVLIALTLVVGSSAVTHGSVATSFFVDLAPTGTFASAGAATLELDYVIGGSGNISLTTVALTSGGGAASPARWGQVDNAIAGSTSATALFGTSLKLTYSGSANPILNYPSGGYTNGAVLVTQGEGNATALESGEFVAFTVSGTAADVPGFALNLVDFSYANRLANGQSSFGVEDTDGTVIQQLVPNTSTSGTISGAGISLTSGQTMTFRPITGNAGGAGLSGFTFDVVAVPEPSAMLALSSGSILCFWWTSRRWRKAG